MKASKTLNLNFKYFSLGDHYSFAWLRQTLNQNSS